MRGITEERLRDLVRDECDLSIEELTRLECTELNSWQPIESAPRDCLILIYDLGYGKLVADWSEHHQCWITVFGYQLKQVTHWAELQEDPK